MVLYAQGRAITAREGLIRWLALPASVDPAGRLTAYETLLDICLASYADDCLTANIEGYLAAAKAAPVANSTLRAERVRAVAYFLFAARLAFGRREVTAAILTDPAWADENVFNGELYLRRRLLAARVALAQDKPAEVILHLDKALSLIASLQAERAFPQKVAADVAVAIELLAQVGQIERAYGLLKATGPLVLAILPPRSVEATNFKLTAAGLLMQVGEIAGARRMADEATTTIRTIELDADTRDWLLGPAVRLSTLAATNTGDIPAARRAIDAHPAAALYKVAGRRPQSDEEVAYLATRAFVAGLEGAPDLVVRAALSDPTPITDDPTATTDTQVSWAAGRAFSLPTLVERRRALQAVALGLREKAAGARLTGAWFRPNPVDSTLTALALTGLTGPETDDLAFALMQLSARTGPSFDADALAALGGAQDALQRRAVHQALRLRARRDRLERTQIQLRLQILATGRASSPGPLGHDPALRGQFRDLSRQLDITERAALATGVKLSGASLVGLTRLQAVLAPDEAALTLAPAAAGLAYMCVRRDRVVRATQQVDFARLALDRRVLQGALTAGHAPSEALDSQFPAEAAVRLYDVLIRPFEACLKPADRIIWLPSVAFAGLPLAALLPTVPSKLADGGYDLAAADWLVKRHAVSYAGSAAALLASRTSRAAAIPSFDFLGIGDPVLGGGAFANLAPLPETRDELAASARGFAKAEVLVGDAATERRLRGQLISEYRYLSFATHGLLREDLQGLSEPALVLTPVSMTDPSDDGLLTAPEIADFNLAARFVALSACNTANFDLSQAAQDLPALASAFAVAGVPSTLGTLWPVNSETSRRVVSEIFARLRAAPGQGPSEALAAAQRAFLAAPPSRAFLHPRFWAPFVILGDGGDLADSPQVSGALTVTSIERLPGVREALDPPGRPRPVRETTVERGAQPSEVRIMVRDGSAPPQLLAAVESPGGEALDYATATPLGPDLIVTLTARRARLASPPTYTLDDWDDPLCVSEPVTWIQRRDGQTGALKAATIMRGLDIAAALPRGRTLWLGGSRTPGCGVATQAVVLALGEDLATRLIHSDQTPGASAVWSLSPLPGGRTLVAATKVSSVDAPPAGWAVSGMMFTLTRDGHASAPKLLDAGAPVFVNRADAQDPRDIRLAGGLGGQGVVLHLSMRP